MKIVRVYSDERGETHFSEVEVELADAGQIGLLSRPLAAKSVIFRKNYPDYDYGWHMRLSGSSLCCLTAQ